MTETQGDPIDPDAALLAHLPALATILENDQHSLEQVAPDPAL